MNSIVTRFKSAMAVQIRNVVGHDWGWFSREDPRMHIQTVDEQARKGPNKVRVWLENKGKRTFEVSAGTLSGQDVKKLKAKVEAEREVLEVKWIGFMIRQGWITATLKGSTITVVAYPGSHNKFNRKVDLTKLFPGVNDWSEAVVDFDQTLGMLRIGSDPDLDQRDHIALEDFLFE